MWRRCAEIKADLDEKRRQLGGGCPSRPAGSQEAISGRPSPRPRHPRDREREQEPAWTAAAAATAGNRTAATGAIETPAVTAMSTRARRPCESATVTVSVTLPVGPAV